MTESLRVLCVMAHPDDESLGVGGLLARYAAEGVETYLLTATHGERGWSGDPAADPGLEEMARIRTVELQGATAKLRLTAYEILNYIDGDLDQAPPEQITAEIAAAIRRWRPQVVVTFAPDGAYGHPDHIAISQFTTAALLRAQDPAVTGAAPYRVSKLYYFVNTNQQTEAYQALFGQVTMEVNGVARGMITWPDWAVTTRVDTYDYRHIVLQAIQCHQSQIEMATGLANISDEMQKKMLGCQMLYRAMSLVNGGSAVEKDIFEGIR